MDEKFVFKDTLLNNSLITPFLFLSHFFLQGWDCSSRCGCSQGTDCFWPGASRLTWISAPYSWPSLLTTSLSLSFSSSSSLFFFLSSCFVPTPTPTPPPPPLLLFSLLYLLLISLFLQFIISSYFFLFLVSIGWKEFPEAAYRFPWL